jgi:diguanylate cyclase
MSGSQDKLSSLALANATIEKIHALRLSAMPSNYEIWYTYCSGANPALNRDINQIINAKGSIDQVELEQVCLSHLHSMRVEQRVRRVETDFGGRLHAFVRLLDDALRDTAEYGDALSGAV